MSMLTSISNEEICNSFVCLTDSNGNEGNRVAYLGCLKSADPEKPGCGRKVLICLDSQKDYSHITDLLALATSLQRNQLSNGKSEENPNLFENAQEVTFHVCETHGNYELPSAEYIQKLNKIAGQRIAGQRIGPKIISNCPSCLSGHGCHFRHVLSRLDQHELKLS